MDVVLHQVGEEEEDEKSGDEEKSEKEAFSDDKHRRGKNQRSTEQEGYDPVTFRKSKRWTKHEMDLQKSYEVEENRSGKHSNTEPRYALPHRHGDYSQTNDMRSQDLGQIPRCRGDIPQVPRYGTKSGKSW